MILTDSLDDKPSEWSGFLTLLAFPQMLRRSRIARIEGSASLHDLDRKWSAERYRRRGASRARLEMAGRVEDFRSRTGRQRRARTNVRLFTAVFQVIDEAGVRGISVDSVCGMTGLPRGSFYNYLETLDLFLVQVSETIGTVIDKEQVAMFEHEPSAVARISGHLRYFVLRSTSDRACAAMLL